MAQVNIDGKGYDLEAGQNLLHAVLSQHLDLPYFCWHPALGSVGSCRLCAVIQHADEQDQRGRLQMACMMSVQDGMRVSIGAPGQDGPGGFAAQFRKQVIEWLMENHPHDCPVCEEGGECHLQDMTVMAGHVSRRYRGAKRTFRNQQLGPFIGHEMNRCITCYRCVRYYRDYAGGTDLDAFGSRSRMFFGRQEDGVLESEFAGNLVEVCPTGVFTDKPFSATYTRKWDLQSAPSVCPGCAVGCNTLPGERYGLLKRVHNRYHPEVNGYFLCDRGRFGSGFVNSEARLRRPGLKAADGLFEELEPAAAAARLGAILSEGEALGIGSPRASLESNLALKRLVGAENFSPGFSAEQAQLNDALLAIHRAGGARIPSLAEVEAADAVLILGEDVLNTAPRVALALRQAVRNRSLEMAAGAGIPQWQDAGVRGHAQRAKNPLLIAGLAPSGLGDIAAAAWQAPPEAIAAAGFAIAHAIDGRYAAPQGGGDASEGSGGNGRPAWDAAFVAQAVAALGNARKPLIVSGVASGSAKLLEAAANAAWALEDQGKDSALLLVGAEANSMGAALLGGGPSLEEALARLAAGKAVSLLVLENDLFRRVDSALLEESLAKARNLAVLDVLETPTVERADLVLPVASYAESTGTLVNYEGRAQRFYQVFEPAGAVAPSWRWLADAAVAAGRNDLRWRHVDEAVQACAEVAGLEGVAEAAPSAGHRNGAGQRIARMTHRASGRTAQNAHLSVHEPKPPVDEQTPFSYSMEGANAGQPGALLPYVWSPGWNSNQSIFKFQQEVAGPLTGGDAGVRLLEPPAGAQRHQRFRQPPKSVPTGAGLRLLPLHRAFGSEELSGRSPPIAERGAGPELLLHPDDAAACGLEQGKGARSEGLGAFAVRIEPGIPQGCAGLVLGLPDGPSRLPAFAVFAPDPQFRPKRPPNLIARG